MSRVNVTLQNAKAPFYAGVDVGGTNIKLGIVDDLGRCCAYRSIRTHEEQGPQNGMQRAAATVLEMCDELRLEMGEVSHVGLATPGTMNISAGMLLQPHNLPTWWNSPIQAILQSAINKPVAFANDASAAALGEFWVGSGSEFHSMVLFTLGTGVGGGIIVGDISLDGENSAGSELGHTIIDFNDTARMCGCGKRGHLEAYASGKAVVVRAHEELERFPESTLTTRLEQDSQLTPLTVAEEAESGDATARQIVMDTARFLGIGAVNTMHVIDPGVVVFGGAMNFGGHTSELGRAFLDRIRQEVAERAFPNLVGRTQIDFASLGGDAGFIGAAGVARQQHRKHR